MEKFITKVILVILLILWELIWYLFCALTVYLIFFLLEVGWINIDFSVWIWGAILHILKNLFCLGDIIKYELK